MLRELLFFRWGPLFAVAITSRVVKALHHRIFSSTTNTKYCPERSYGKQWSNCLYRINACKIAVAFCMLSDCTSVVVPETFRGRSL